MGSKRTSKLWLKRGAAAAAVTMFAQAVPAFAQEQTYSFDIPAQDLGASLKAFARTARQQVTFDSDTVRGKRAPALKGTYSVRAGLDRLLQGLGLEIQSGRSGVLIIRPARSAPQAATENAGEDIRGSEQEIVVTGSRIAGAGPIGSNAYTVSRADMDRSGVATAQDIIRLIPQNTSFGQNNENRGANQSSQFNSTGGVSINLRGLGSTSTLPLFDGRRFGGTYDGRFVDISLLPSTAIERVEVVADGASAIYGTDAVAGVVNFIPRKQIRGVELSTDYRIYDDAHLFNIGGVTGTTWSGGKIIAAAQYTERSALHAKDRDFLRADLRPFGGSDFRVVGGKPGTITAGGIRYAIPNQDGAALTAAQLTANTANFFDQTAGQDVSPATRSFGAYARIEQALAPDVTAFLSGVYSHRRAEQSLGPQVIAITVPRSNAFFVTLPGATTSETVAYNFGPELGNLVNTGRETGYFGTAGLSWKPGSAWKVELTDTLSRNIMHARSTGGVALTPNLTRALADSNRATAFNPFGNALNSQAVIDGLGVRVTGRDARYTVNSANLDISGTLIALPAGPLRLAAGLEHRSEDEQGRNVSNSTGVFVDSTVNDLDRSVFGQYLELAVPVLNQATGPSFISSLDLSAAVRHENYSDFGETTNPKLGAALRLSIPVRLRATYGTSFRAPSLVVKDSSFNTATVIQNLVDPTSTSGRTNAIFLFGTDPDLGPERATTWSLGADFGPFGTTDLVLSIDYFNIDYRDRIAPGTSTTAVFVNESVYAPIIVRNPGLATIQQILARPTTNVTTVDPSTITALVNAGTRNISSVQDQVLNATLRYSRSAFGGTFLFGVSADYFLKAQSQITSTAPSIDTIGLINFPVRLRGRGYVAFSKASGLSTQFALNYTHGYANNLNTIVQQVPRYVTADATVRIPVVASPSAELIVSVDNIFNRQPPFVNNPAAFGYDPQVASAFGRSVTFGLRTRF